MQKQLSNIKYKTRSEVEAKRREKSLEANFGIWTKEFITNKIK